MHPNQLAPFILTFAIMGWVVYRRVRQNIGRQPVRPTRMMVRMTMLCLVAVAALIVTPAGGVVYELAGAVAGIGLAVYALRLTKFESNPDGMFYTGNLYIGLGLTALLIGRIAYRVITSGGMQATAAAHAGQAPPTPSAAFASAFANPLTAAILLVTVGYYVTFYAGLLMKARTASTPA